MAERTKTDMGAALRSGAPMLLAGFTIVLSGALLTISAGPETEPARWLAGLLPSPRTWSARADKTVDRLSPTTNAVRESAVADVRRAPARAELRLRLAYADYAGGRFAESGAALADSYALSPIDDRIARWRLPLVLRLWTELDPSVRRSAMAEFRTLWRREPLRPWLASLAESAGPPSARLALALALQTLSSPGRLRREAMRPPPAPEQ